MIRLRLLSFACVSVVTCTCLAAPAAKVTATNGPPPIADGIAHHLKIHSYDNGDASVWAEAYRFDSAAHPMIVELRRRYKLDAVVSPAGTDLERALRLKKWLRSRFRAGTPTKDTFEDWSAVTLLKRMDEGEQSWCGQSAMIMQQACVAVGMPSRFVELGNPGNPACHFTTEVFLREFDKWAIIDATPLDAFDVYFEADGVPLSALELHARLVEDEAKDVVEVRPAGRSPVLDKKQLEHFYYVRWLTRCDVVSNTPKFEDMQNTFNRWRDTVGWEDRKTVPWEDQTYTQWWTRNQRLSAWRTSDPNVVNWRPTSRVRIVMRPETGSRGGVFFQLWSADPNFAGFQVRIDGGAWTDLRTGDLQVAGQGIKRYWLPPNNDVRRFETRVKLVNGSLGPTSYVTYSSATE